jgi:hypothetical protein
MPSRDARWQLIDQKIGCSLLRGVLGFYIDLLAT